MSLKDQFDKILKEQYMRGFMDGKEFGVQIKSWQFEDEMTENSMYDALYPLSKVSNGGVGVRIFPKKIVVENGQ